MSTATTQRENLNFCRFTWSIKNFLLSFCKNEGKIESPKFTADVYFSGKEELYLCLDTKSSSGNIKDEIYFSLQTKVFFEFKVKWKTDCEIDLVDPHGNILRSFKSKFTNPSCVLAEYHMPAKELLENVKSWDEDTLVIRCMLSNYKKVVKVLPSEYEALTIIDGSTLTTQWFMENFIFTENMQSVCLCGADNLFQITLGTFGEDVAISIHLSEPDELPETTLLFRLTFLNSNGTKIATKSEIHSFKSMNPWQFPTFVKMNLLCPLKSASSRSSYIFVCEIRCTDGTIKYSEIEKRAVISNVKNDSILEPVAQAAWQSDYLNLFVSKKYSDIKLRIVDEEFSAHRAILAARSPVFAAMFDQDMLENQTRIVDIVDMDVKTLQNLMKFIYSETLDNMDHESSLKLLLAADKYQMQTLVEECSSLIMNTLSADNACEVICIANMLNHEELKRNALNCIFANASKLLATPEWCEWVRNNVNLAADILCKYSKYLERLSSK